jgi:Fe2+-dicitrate sensor, membrane component
VILAGASGITVDYRPEVRQVQLTDGQALFTVAKDPGRPFIVKGGMGSVQAVGTNFDVHRTPRGAIVTVVSGKVIITTRFGDQQARAWLRNHAGITEKPRPFRGADHRR